MGYMLNLANLNYDSRVLIVDNTRGLLTGGVLERGVNYCQQVEFNQDQTIKYKAEHLLQMDLGSAEIKALSVIASQLLIQTNPEDPDDVDPLFSNLKKKFKKYFNSFIFAHDQLHPAEVFPALRPYLQPGCPVAIYSQYLQPLTELAKPLLQAKSVIDCHIEELWTREHQVLPLRTHPFMSVNGQSGYVLSFIVMA